MDDLTPMLRQYLEIKERHRDAILFFRMGDFYEMFFEDAHVAAKALDITLTSRNKLGDEAIPMAGVPHHAAQGYIARLIEQGFKIAICDQIEDARFAKGIVKRDVTQVITPGLVLESETLDAKANNFLLGLFRRRGRYGIAYLDISTQDFYTAEPTDLASLRNELSRIEPRELLLPQSLREDPDLDPVLSELTCLKNWLSDDLFELEPSREKLLEHFQVAGLEGFGCQDYTSGLCAAGAVLSYLEQTRPAGGFRLDRLIPYEPRDYLVMDESTRRNLELFRTLQEGKKSGSLLSLIDETVTPMGGRLLRRWLSYPLIDPARISARLDAVDVLLQQGQQGQHEGLRTRLRQALAQVADLERLNAKIVGRTANARDLAALRLSLEQIPDINRLCAEAGAEALSRFTHLDPCDPLVQRIAAAIADDPSSALKEGGIIREGYNAELDELHALTREGKGFVARMEARERARTGIQSLKIKYNKVFGYFIEITKSNLDAVPADYYRKQTLTGAERFITPELKEYETKILGAEEKMIDLEYQLFVELREELAARQHRVKEVAMLLAELDALQALGETASRYRYVRPHVDATEVLDITEGRHPVVERATGKDRFTANDIRLDTRERQVIILTGPNMAGKSTIMRQVALITLLAQVGSFVPARSARIGVVDRIFTRVGASDNLAKGQSTFMVEMTETAHILHHATQKSLVVLDEIGRGTSTFDGLSIAWAVAETLHDRIGCKVLFATHYHELIDLALTRPRVKNYTIAVAEWGEKVVFLRKLKEGGASRSYGIQVARLAGLPREVLDRAKEVLANLEKGELNELGEPRLARRRGAQARNTGQLSLFAASTLPPPSPVLELLRTLDPNCMTPLEALSRLAELRDLLAKSG